MSRTVGIRMYNLGFADCFLISVAEDDRVMRILVDCGENAFGPIVFPVEDVIADITATATEPGRPFLDVVVATNPHRDHIAGFAAAGWQDVSVGEVWMPWVEHPADEEAVRTRRRHAQAARDLSAVFSANAEGMLARNSLRAERAMWTLRHGFAGNPHRRYSDELVGAPSEATGLPGVLAHVLGPSQSTDIQPATNAVDREWRAHDTTAIAHGQAAPFADGYRITPEQYERRYGAQLDVPSDRLLAQLAVKVGDPFAALCQLDRAVNNQSLFFVLEIGEVVLVFPGDAQWAAWQPVLDDPATRQLLSRTTVYKASHHGSYTGTPRRFASEILPGTATSLLPAGAGPWDDVPNHDLIDELGGHGRLLVRSDDNSPQPPVVRHPNGLWSEITINA